MTLSEQLLAGTAIFIHLTLFEDRLGVSMGNFAVGLPIFKLLFAPLDAVLLNRMGRYSCYSEIHKGMNSHYLMDMSLAEAMHKGLCIRYSIQKSGPCMRVDCRFQTQNQWPTCMSSFSLWVKQLWEEAGGKLYILNLILAWNHKSHWRSWLLMHDSRKWPWKSF